MLEIETCACSTWSFEVLLVLWSTPVSDKFELLDIFAGRGNVAAVWSENGRSVCKYDWDTDGSMNFYTEGGFALGPQFVQQLLGHQGS